MLDKFSGDYHIKARRTIAKQQVPDVAELVNARTRSDVNP
jgi:hypothetical protein